MATLRVASKEALLSKNITPLSELWVTRRGPNTGRNSIARATGNNADFEKGFIGKNGARNWNPIGSGYTATDKYRCFGARCIEISTSSGASGLETAGEDIVGIGAGDPISLSVYYNVISYNSGTYRLIVKGRSGSSWINVATLSFGSATTDGWQRATLITNSPGTYSALKYEISSSNYSGVILIDRPQVEFYGYVRDFQNGNEYTDKAPNVLGYTIDIDRNFGANTMTVECANPNGNYSYDKNSAENTIGGQTVRFFDLMNRVVLKEGIVGTDGREEWWTKFTGYIDNQTPRTSGDTSMISVDCTDAMKMLLIDNIDRSFQPNTIYVDQEELTTTDVDRLVFDSANENWAKHPPPEVYLDGELMSSRDYTIDYARGKVYFNYMIEPDEVITVSYHYYEKGTNTLGEVIRRICREKGFDVGIAFDENDEYQLGGVENVEKSRNPVYAGEVLLDFFDPRVSEYIEPQVPPTMMELDENINHFEAIQRIRRGIIAPNFILKADAHGNIRGFYSFQKLAHDHDILLPQSMDLPVSDEDIYTRVVVYGRSDNNRGLVRFAKIQKHQASHYEQGKVENVLDGRPDTEFVQHWGDYKDGNRDYSPPVSVDNRGKPESPFPFITLDFGKNVSELIADHYDFDETKGVELIQIEGCNPVNTEIFSAGRVGSGAMSFAIKYRKDGETEWKYLTESTKDVRVGKNQLVSINLNDADNIVDFRYLRLEATHLDYYQADYSTKKGTGVRDAWCIGISGIEVWPNNRLVGEAMADADLIEKLGVRTYVVSENPMLDTVQKCQDMAELVLREVSRNIRRMNVTVVYAPYIELGDTVKVEDSTHGISKLFYVESIRHRKGNIVPTVDISLVSYQ